MFAGRDYVQLADELSAREDEASHRSSVSRAYYGVFCLARDRASYEPAEGEDSHRRLIESYKFSSKREEIRIGQKLDDLRRQRNLADYHAEALVRKTEASQAVQSAQTLLAWLEPT